MQWLGLVVALWLAIGAWGQSLGDVARASRERKKPAAAKVITNEDVEPKKPVSASTSTGDLNQELDRVRQILRGICADPNTDHGRDLSDYDKQMIADGVKPLRARVNVYERIQKRYKDELDEVEKYYEAEFQKIYPHDRPLTQSDIDGMKALRLEYEGKKEDLVNRAKRDKADYRAFQKELESAGKECPLAAQTVPD